jgi:tripartite-type tricarboxylate transporter receptor subunit TctC
MAFTLTRRDAIVAGLASTAGLAMGPARAQDWPSALVRIISSHPPGGLTDGFARAYGDYITQKTGQTVLVENKAGAGGTLAAQAVKSAPADGHTLLITISTTMLQNRVLFKQLPYDPDRDFAMISVMPSGHLPFLAHRSTGVGSIKELVEYARKNTVSIGTYSPGSMPHLVTTLLNKQFGLNMTAVHYRGEAPMWQDFAAGVLQCACGSYQGAAGALDSGTGRAIAVPTRVRMKKLPDVQTFAEQGVEAAVLQSIGWIGLFAPAATPPAVIERISGLVYEGGRSERVRGMLDTFGIDASALDRAASMKIYDEEGPLWIDAVKGLGLAQQ